MQFFRPGLFLWQRIALVASIAALLVGLAAMVYGEWATSIGFPGVVNHGIGGVGFVLLGVSLFGFFVIVAVESWRGRPNDCCQVGGLLRRTAREMGAVALNAVCYVGTVLVALGAFTALDRVVVAPLVTIAVCVAVFVLYRRYRSRHKIEYVVATPVGILVFLLAVVVVCLIGGATIASNAVADGIAGPRTGLCTLVDVDKSHPSGRYRYLRTSSFELDFKDSLGERVHLSIKQQDADVVRQIADAGGVALITYYPRTHVLVQAESMS